MINEEDPLLYDDDFENGNEQKISLADVWNNNPAIKLFAIAGVLGITIIAFLFLGNNNKPDVSRVATASTNTETPGQGELTPAYEEALKKADEQRIQEAQTKGGSVFPTPIARPTERIESPPEEEVEDPLEKWRREAEKRHEERLKEKPQLPPALPATVSAPQPTALPSATGINPQQQLINQLPTGPTPEQVENMTELFGEQFGVILQARIPGQSTLVNQGIGRPFTLNQDESFTGNPLLIQENTALAGNTGTAAETPEVVISAGTIEYGQIITKASSDIPGPVLAEIASGPFAGARIIGTFQSTERHLVLTFNKAIIDKKEYAVNIVAVDPSTTLTGVATDINHHYFTRVILPGAAAFIEGFASAVVRQGTTVSVEGETVTSSQDDLNTGDELLAGFEESASEFSDILDDQSDREPTIIVENGTRVGLLFLDTVFENEQ